MGTKAIEILNLDAKNLIDLLNRAYADEWLAYYQYWIGAKVVKGPMKGTVIAELEEHAADELRHAGMLAQRIIQLGGTPLIKPEEWYKHSNCGYDAPENLHVKEILHQNIKGEQCAITTYKKLVDLTAGKDPVTNNMVLEILADEIEHEDDLQAELEDFETLVKSHSK